MKNKKNGQKLVFTQTFGCPMVAVNTIYIDKEEKPLSGLS